MKLKHKHYFCPLLLLLTLVCEMYHYKLGSDSVYNVFMYVQSMAFDQCCYSVC